MEIDKKIATPATMDDLASELLIRIFEHLKIRDLIQCSLVCKRFKTICKLAKIPELIVSSKTENIKDLWFYTKEQFNHQDAIEVATFNSYRSVFNLNKFKRLHFKGSKAGYCRLNVKELTQLEQLKIDVRVAENDIIHIDVPNIKIIEIDANPTIHTFFVTTPKLEMLKCMNLDDIHLTYPNTVEHLEATKYSHTIGVLKNIQYFRVDYDSFQYSIISSILSIFPKLKTLALIWASFYPPTTIESLRYLVEQSLQRSDLKIYFESVENANLYSEINYNKLMDLVGGILPDDFSKKYCRTTRISVTGQVANPEHLFRFLSSFGYLTNIYLESDSLDQSFCDRLCELQQLTRVVVVDSSQSIDNYNFFLKLKLLENFSTTSECPQFFDLTPELLKHLKYFHIICFHFETDVICIERLTLTCYNFRRLTKVADIDRAFSKSAASFDELARLIDMFKRSHVNTINQNYVPHLLPSYTASKTRDYFW